MSTDPKSVIPRSVLDVMQSLSTVHTLEAARRPPAADPRDLIAASLAGGVIAASGREWTGVDGGGGPSLCWR